MPVQTPESQSPHDVALLAELAATARGLVTEAEAVVSTLRSKLEEAEVARASLTDAAASALIKLAEISATATSAIAARTQVGDEQAVIATKSTHIQAAQEHADKVRAELDRALTSATQQATEAEGQRTRAQTATDTAAELLAAIRAHKASADTELAATTAAHELAKTAAATAKNLADMSASTEERIAEYETRLAALDVQSNTQLETITGLLPGATSAGLAHAFDDRRQTFLKPATRWQWLFVGSVAALVVLALTGLWNVYRENSLLGWDDLARLWLARLPIAGALVWLALHASRESALAKRLEEDYGYKAAIASSFQGFQKQMADIGTSAPQGSPLSKLCDDTLSTIASPPGRIYDKHRLTVTPAGELASAATKVVSPDRQKG
jgi:hypothetical protein